MKTILLAALLAAVSIGCQAESPTAATAQVIAPEALLASPPEGVLILDVRTPEEFAAGHVPEAVNIPHDQLAARLPELDAAKSSPIVVYCERGGRAKKAEGLLLGAGYRDVLHLDGDMSAWRAAGRPTAKP